METKLARISQLSKENPDMVFTSLGHLINKEMLKSCHAQMDGTKAVGIDGITKEEYGRRLEENISALIERLKKKSYRPKPARLVEIPKIMERCDRSVSIVMKISWCRKLCAEYWRRCLNPYSMMK